MKPDAIPPEYAAAAAPPRRSDRRRRGGDSDRAGAPAQPRQPLPLPLRQPLLLSDRLRRAGSSPGIGSEQIHPVLPRKEPRARDLGRLPLRSGSGARALRLRRSASDRGARSGNGASAGEPPHAPLPHGRRRGMGRARDPLGECGARSRARRHRRAGARAGRARAGRRHAPGQGCARARHHAPRGAHRRAGAPPRDAAHAARAHRVRGRGRAALRVPPQWRAIPGLFADRRRWRQCLRAALRLQRRAAARRRPAADRRRLRARRLRLRHHAHLPGERTLQRRAARGLRDRARLAARRDGRRCGPAAAGTSRTMPRSRCWPRE